MQEQAQPLFTVGRKYATMKKIDMHERAKEKGL